MAWTKLPIAIVSIIQGKHESTGSVNIGNHVDIQGSYTAHTLIAGSIGCTLANCHLDHQAELALGGRYKHWGLDYCTGLLEWTTRLTHVLFVTDHQRTYSSSIMVNKSSRICKKKSSFVSLLVLQPLYTTMHPLLLYIVIMLLTATGFLHMFNESHWLRIFCGLLLTGKISSEINVLQTLYTVAYPCIGIW